MSIRTNFTKYAVVVLLAACNPIGALAQRDNCYVDAGISWARLLPGPSVTYNHNFFRYVGLGVGFQAYDFHAIMPTFEVVPTFFGELRANIRPRKEHQYFVFFDLGINLYYHEDDNYWIEDNVKYTVAKDNGTYAGIGIGYAWLNKKNYFGYYISLKMISNNYRANGIDLASGEHYNSGWGDQTLVTSFGFKF